MFVVNSGICMNVTAYNFYILINERSCFTEVLLDICFSLSGLSMMIISKISRGILKHVYRLTHRGEADEGEKNYYV